MGLDHSFEVFVNAFANNVNVKIEDLNFDVMGDLTYRVNVCADRLEHSTLNLDFLPEDSTIPSFSFHATRITLVSFDQDGKYCDITVGGVGEVDGVSYSFNATFRDHDYPSKISSVEDFIITDLFDQSRAVVFNEISIKD
ncbi:hypothetical protein ACFYKX_01330 [Cytobacillus sp. FJAT-54145]|uniref:Uncharacterized protein n=1 Tax=Cytobacillus spartinae TaxID=3299023 RepID=A0ABW6K523_9BACI